MTKDHFHFSTIYLNIIQISLSHETLASAAAVSVFIVHSPFPLLVISTFIFLFQCHRFYSPAPLKVDATTCLCFSQQGPGK